MSIHVNNHTAPKPDVTIKLVNQALLKPAKVGLLGFGICFLTGLFLPQYSLSTAWTTRVDL
jgi:hypothetical protein